VKSVPIPPTGERERAQALLEMGFDGTQSVLLAATGAGGAHIDIEALRDLLDAGCDHELALRIVL
jgi:hypothetical protein